MTKYRIKKNKTNSWKIQSKNHWWSFWKTIDEKDKIEKSYAVLIEQKLGISIPVKVKFQHNRDKTKMVWCDLVLEHKNGIYLAGYKPKNYHNYYYATFGSQSYEDVLVRLYWELELKRIIKNAQENDELENKEK